MPRQQPSVFPLKEQDLAAIRFHSPVPGIERVIAQGFPLHLAVHRVDGVEDAGREYVRPHRHPTPEINLILGGEGELVYSLRLGDEVQQVVSPAAVWVPAEVLHSANVISGSGYFVCLLLDEVYRALGEP